MQPTPAVPAGFVSMNGAQTSRNLPVTDPLSRLHLCDALQPPLFLERPSLRILGHSVVSQLPAPIPSTTPVNQPVFVPSGLAPASCVLNSSTFFLGMLAVFTVLAWKARTVRKIIEDVDGDTAPTTPTRNIAEYAIDNGPAPSPFNLSSDLEDSLDQPLLLSPTGSGYFTTPSSPKMLTTSEAPSPMSLSIDSPAFRHIWKSNAIATAEIAHKRRRSTVVAKLQRWATKRHEQAAQEARSLKLLASNSRTGSSDGLSLITFDDQHGGLFGSGRSDSPRAAQKLRYRREGLKMRAREVAVVRAVLYDGEL